MSLFTVRAPWGRESLAHGFRRLQSPRRARTARPDRRRRRVPRRARRPAGHVGGGAGSARGPRHAGRARGARRPAGAVDPSARQVPADRPRARRGRLQPDADRPLPAGRARATGRRPRQRSSSGSARARAAPADAATWTRGASWLPATMRDPRSAIAIRRRWARSTSSRPASSDRSRARRAGAGSRRGRPGAHARGLARTDPAPPGRAQEPAPQPGVRRRDRQRLQRRDPARGAPAPPFRKRSTLASEEVDELYAATRTTLQDAIAILRERVPPTFETQVRDFLAVHDKGGQPCPRCGTRITEVRAGGFITSYCRGCQR